MSYKITSATSYEYFYEIMSAGHNLMVGGIKLLHDNRFKWYNRTYSINKGCLTITVKTLPYRLHEYVAVFLSIDFFLSSFFQPQCPPVESNFRQPIIYSPVYTDDIRWNFEKFLIGPDGRPLYKYSRFIDPRSNELIIADIMIALKKMSTPESGDPLVG